MLKTNSNSMNERIIAFLEGQKVASICCVDENNTPCCFSCFYAFDRLRNLLYFKSSVNTQHGMVLQKAPRVAGTIQPNKLNPLAIKGIQFKGTILGEDDPFTSNAKSFYHNKHPFAIAVPGEVWTIQLQQVKMTDNTLSFAKKITWQRENAVEA